MTAIEFRVEQIGPHEAALRCLVDGADLLAGFEYGCPVDPDELVPPLSDALLPTRGGRTAVIGVCGCGFAGCGSVSVRIRREGAVVLWEPVEDAEHETLREAYGFDLTSYLDAVDAAAEHPGDSQTRRVARRLRVALGIRAALGDVDGRYINQAELLHMRALADGQLAVTVSLAPAVQRHHMVRHDFTPLPEESDSAYATRVLHELFRQYV